MKFGLLAKVLLISLFVTLTGVVTVFWSTSQLFARAYTDALESRSQAIAQGLRLQLERILQLGIRLDDLYGFEKQCLEAMQAYDGVQFAAVVNREGVIVFHSDRNRHGERLESAELQRGIAAGTASTIAVGTDGTAGRAVVVPVTGIDGSPIAGVMVGISSEIVHVKLAEMQRGRLGIGIVALLVGFGVFIAALSYFVVRPVRRLTRSVEEIRAHATNLAYRVDLESSDEVGTLAAAFNGPDCVKTLN